jgi:hypothetical protein
MYEYRSGCDGRLKTEAEGSTRLGHTGLRVGTDTTKGEEENCFLGPIWVRDFHSRTKKPVMSKRKFCCTEPDRLLTKFTTQNQKNKKENQSFFIVTILYIPEGWNF